MTVIIVWPSPLVYAMNTSDNYHFTVKHASSHTHIQHEMTFIKATGWSSNTSNMRPLCLWPSSLCLAAVMSGFYTILCISRRAQPEPTRNHFFSESPLMLWWRRRKHGMLCQKKNTWIQIQSSEAGNIYFREWWFTLSDTTFLSSTAVSPWKALVLCHHFKHSCTFFPDECIFFFLFLGSLKK